MGLLNSKVAMEILTYLAPTINYGPEQINKIPILYSEDDEIENLVKQNIQIARYDWNLDETSLEFEGHFLLPNADWLEENGNELNLRQIYEKWTKQVDARLSILKSNEEKLNDKFIKIYGVEGDILPQEDIEEVTLRRNNPSKDIRSFISYAVGCMFGRYSINHLGVEYAGGEWDMTNYCGFMPDEDNVIPITDDEYFSDDIVGRFCEWLKFVYGEENLEENLDFIAEILGNKNESSRTVIRNYFLKDFMSDHTKMYQKRPIYWMFDSGKEDGFKALIYMHRYTADTVGIVRTDYLHKTQKAIEQAMQREEYASENALSASDKKKAVQKITKYTKQLAQMKSYDEAMAHIANQRIEIDLDDGVKVNYEKFQGVEVAQEGKKALKIDLLAKIK